MTCEQAPADKGSGGPGSVDPLLRAPIAGFLKRDKPSEVLLDGPELLVSQNRPNKVLLLHPPS